MKALDLLDKFNALPYYQKMYCVQFFLGSTGAMFEGFADPHEESEQAQWALKEFELALNKTQTASLGQKFQKLHSDDLMKAQRDVILDEILVTLAGCGVATPEKTYKHDGGVALAMADIKRAIYDARRDPRHDEIEIRDEQHSKTYREMVDGLAEWMRLMRLIPPGRDVDYYKISNGFMIALKDVEASIHSIQSRCISNEQAIKEHQHKKSSKLFLDTMLGTLHHLGIWYTNRTYDSPTGFTMALADIEMAIKESRLRKEEWSQELPREEGQYWFWDGNEKTSIAICSIFINRGKLYCGNFGARVMDDIKGWWLKQEIPKKPTISKDGQPKKNGRYHINAT